MTTNNHDNAPAAQPELPPPWRDPIAGQIAIKLSDASKVFGMGRERLVALVDSGAVHETRLQRLRLLDVQSLRAALLGPNAPPMVDRLAGKLIVPLKLAAEVAGVDGTTLTRLYDAGELRMVRTGRSYYVDVESLRALLAPKPPIKGHCPRRPAP